jgi:hypothetical protein
MVACFHEAAGRHGFPVSVLTDNGAMFTAGLRGGGRCSSELLSVTGPPLPSEDPMCTRCPSVPDWCRRADWNDTHTNAGERRTGARSSRTGSRAAIAECARLARVRLLSPVDVRFGPGRPRVDDGAIAPRPLLLAQARKPGRGLRSEVLHALGFRPVGTVPRGGTCGTPRRSATSSRSAGRSEGGRRYRWPRSERRNCSRRRASCRPS